jgi:hypothetical protein
MSIFEVKFFKGELKEKLSGGEIIDPTFYLSPFA